MRSYFDFSAEEKTIILAAIKVRKEESNDNDSDPETISINENDLNEALEIEEEIQKENIQLSRNQLNAIGTYLGPLMDENIFDQLDISALEDKISEITDLP